MAIELGEEISHESFGETMGNHGKPNETFAEIFINGDLMGFSVVETK